MTSNYDVRDENDNKNSETPEWMDWEKEARQIVRTSLGCILTALFVCVFATIRSLFKWVREVQRVL